MAMTKRERVMKLRRSVPLLALVAMIAAMAFAPAAQSATPAPGYERFAGCPKVPDEYPGPILACIRSVITGGHFQMGSKDVPITNPITLSGGANEETGAIVANSKGGLTPVKQKVPGGVVGLTGLTWLLELLGSEALTLYAVTEIAGQPFINTDLTLPIKVHLVNSVLGNNCYVGSVSNPIVLKLTTGTTSPPPPNLPIKGAVGLPEYNEATGIIKQKLTYVDNSFAAPGATGCVLTLFGFIPISINGLVNTQSGLPSAAGRNETVQVTETELAFPQFVYP